MDPLLYRLTKVFRFGSHERSLPVSAQEVFDADRMIELVQQVVEEAAVTGNCVIVGRGAQCILQHKPDVYHAFVYAPLKERILRCRERLEKGANIEQRIRTVDEQRAKYLQQFFGKSWCNLHLYDLMISSQKDEDSTARVILYAMTGQTKEAIEHRA